MTDISQRAVRVLATWFGCGLMPRAPGTFGTLGAIPLAIGFAMLGPMPYLVATLVFAIAAIFVAHFYEALTGHHDDQAVVIDEVAGYLVTMAWVPMTWGYILAGFLLFRLFDVWKPYPISYVDKHIGGGVGCVGDDLLAGILSNIILQVVLSYGWLR
jgi:phosphatidylglycerophosphatase A